MTFDIQLFYLLNNLAGQSLFLDNVIVFLASYLAYMLVTVFLILIFFSHYQKREKWEIFLVTVISSIVARFGITELIRFFYHRPRPFSMLEAHQLLSNGEWSFPSGHAAFFFAMATAVYLYNKKWGIGFFIAATLMAVSRVVAGIHYPSDIVGGALIGILVAYITFYSARRIVTPQTQKTTISTY